ncbi:MAG: putative immunity protein [Dermatophilaceae bacterium]
MCETREGADTLGDFELTMDELRAIAVYAVACAEPALVLFHKTRPDDHRPAAALHAARVFAEGAPRSHLLRAAAADAHRAARDVTTESARHAAKAAGDAAAAATKEAAIDTYRVALERRGVDTAPWWDAQLALCLLGALVQFGWEKALGGYDDELAWWESKAVEGARLLV